MCARGREIKHKRLSVEETQSGVEAAVFQAYGHPLSTLSFLKCLDRVLMAAYDDWLEVIFNSEEGT